MSIKVYQSEDKTVRDAGRVTRRLKFTTTAC